jgi:uncharacterized protein YecE (DUF72 family)
VITNFKLGMQGWNHQEWVGRAYPTNISSAQWLTQYARRFPTVEIDDTFYGLPPEPLVRRWRESVESDFTFAPKVPQQISHEQRFTVGGGLLSRFLDRISLLEDALGPLLLIAPLGFRTDNESVAKLHRFINQLPSDFRWALELKHAGWCTDETFDLLESKNVAFVVGASRWIRLPLMLKLSERPTADFAYVRWHGPPAGKTAVREPIDVENPAAVWNEPLVRLSGLVGAVYGYFHLRAYGDGLRSAQGLQYCIDQRQLEASASDDGVVR